MALLQSALIGLLALIITPGLLFYFDVTPKIVVLLLGFYALCAVLIVGLLVADVLTAMAADHLHALGRYVVLLVVATFGVIVVSMNISEPPPLRSSQARLDTGSVCSSDSFLSRIASKHFSALIRS